MAYQYTLLSQDGTTTDLGTSAKRKDFADHYKTLNCHTIEIMPRAFHPKGMIGTVYGDEMGRFDADNHTNPHMQVITDTWGTKHDCVGNLLHEKRAK